MLKAQIVTFPSGDGQGEALSVAFRYIDRPGEKDWRLWTGFSFNFPHITDKHQAEAMRRELAEVMTALERYIGRQDG